jgi:hypothetical protein
MQAQTSKKCADVTRDGKVNVEDLLSTLAQFNTKCTISGGGGAPSGKEKQDPLAKNGQCRDIVVGRHDGNGVNRFDNAQGTDRVHTNGGQAYCAPVGEKHEVRCVSKFSLTSKGGIYKKCLGKDFFSISTKIKGPGGATAKAQCQHGLTYNQAVLACRRLGARLPTRAEVDRNCAAGGGCNHDNDLIWTSSSGLPKKAQLVARRKTCKDVGKASYNAHEFEYCVSKSERHEVRCCSDKAVKGFAKKRCGSKKVGKKTVPKFIWTESNAKSMLGCQSNRNWNQANTICKKAGARLCTLSELRQHCTMGTGCQHDHDLVWTNSNKLYTRPGLPKVSKTKVKGPATGFETGTIKLTNTVAKRIVLKSKFMNPIIFLGTPSHKGGNEVVMRLKRRGWVTNDANERQRMAFRPTWFDMYMDTPNHGARRQTARACKDFNPAGKTAAQKCPAALKGQEKNCANMRTMYACVTRRVQTRGAGTVGACRLQTHTTETVSYMVVEGRMANIRTNSPKTMYRAGKLNAQNFGWKTVRFSGARKVGTKMVNNPNDPNLKKSVVLSQIQSHNGADWVKTRMRKVTATGFQVKMEETTIDKNHNQEQIGWMALPVGRGRLTAQLQFETFVTPNKVTHKPYTVTFKNKFKVAPFFFSAMQTTDGGDPTHMRYQTLTNKKASFFTEEETCSDKEIAHTTEVVGVLALGP